MRGEVAGGEAGAMLHEHEIRILHGGEDREDRETGGLVDQPIQPRQDLRRGIEPACAVSGGVFRHAI